MRKNNRGFTLIELIIATALLGIVVVGVFGFMMAGASSYRSVSTATRLELTARQAMNQMRDTVIDCNTAVYTSLDGLDGLYFLNRNADDTYTVRAYTLLDSEIDFQETVCPADVDEGGTALTAERHLLTSDVTNFNVTMTEDGAAVTAVNIELQYTRQGKSYRERQTVALRNAPKAARSLSDLLDCAK